MYELKRMLTRANISAPQLAEAVGIPLRTLNYQYSSGRITFAMVYKLHIITGLTIEEIVPKPLAENWVFLMDEATKSNKPRGKIKRTWAEVRPKEEPKTKPEPKPTPVPRETKWSKNLELDSPPAGQSPKEKQGDPEPQPIVRKPPAPPKKSTIADLMKASPAPEPPDPDAPDFSNIDDSVFNTSADQNPVRKKR